MAKRKGTSTRTKGPSRPRQDLLPLAQMMEQLLGSLGDDIDDSGDALDAAQQIMYDAWESDSKRKRVALAKKALDISPLCADAYTLLGTEKAATPEEAISLFRQGVEAGEKALGKAAFSDDVGQFWGLLETRPYMRARHFLAMTLWEVGSKDEAVTHYQDMLRLNPNDNQGIRHLLVDGLLALGRDAEAEKLIERYRDDSSASWAWSRVLLLYRREGDRPPTRTVLGRAMKVNAFVRDYLLGHKEMPDEPPEYISPGGEDEAISYMHSGEEAWRAAPGALLWLASADAKVKSAKLGARDRNDNAVDTIDTDRIDDAVLGLLSLGLHNIRMAWKTFDWATLSRLHEKGYITDPVGKQKSVGLTDEGLSRSEQLFREMFGKR